MNYARALNRLTGVAAALGIAGVIVAFLWRGPLFAAGFLAGAILSMANLRWWTSLANALGSSGKTPLRGSAALLALRYLAAAAIIYVIVKFLEIALAAVLAGLFVSVAAVIIEILYELISSE
jgi:hypothetical protein